MITETIKDEFLHFFRAIPKVERQESQFNQFTPRFREPISRELHRHDTETGKQAQEQNQVIDKDLQFPILSGKGEAFHGLLFRNTSQSLSNYCTDALITVFTKLYDVSYAKLTPRFKYLQVSLRISILYFCVFLNMTSLGV